MKKLYFFAILFALLSNSSKAQDVEIQGNAVITGTVEVMDTILFADGSQLASACLGLLQDADGDTKISVEQGSDTDRIVLTSGGEIVAIIDRDNFQIIHKGNSILIGEKAGSSDDGNNSNIFIGNQAGKENISGSGNLYVGAEAGKANQIGVQNTALGHLSGVNAQGANNTFVGSHAGFSGGGNQNTFVGHQAGETMEGSRNTILGSSAGASAKGDGNVLIGANAGKSLAGNNQLIIHNDPSLEPLISGKFDSLKLSLNADTKIEKVLSIENELQMLTLVNGQNNGLKFGFEGEANFGINAFNFRLPAPPYNSLFKRLDFGNYIDGSLNRILTLTSEGNAGIGTPLPRNKLHIVSSSPISHIMKIENTAPGIEGDGLEIKLNRPTNGAGNNFVTFTDEDGVAGRIEGFNTNEDIAMASFPDIDFTDYFDVLTIQNFAFDPGSLPSLTGGQLPSLSGGSFPSFNRGQFPSLNRGTLPSLSGGSFGNFSLDASFDGDAFVSNVLCGPFCTNPQEIYTFNPSITGASFPSLNRGQLPFLSGGQLPSLSGGSFPSINPGNLPTLSGGQLPTLDFDLIYDLPVVSSAFVDLQEVMCWAIENGERSLMTVNSQDLKMMEDVAYLNNLANCKNGGVTYGSGGADYAEYLLRKDRNETIRSGQIVGVRGGKITKSTEGAEQLLVISMMPVVLGNMPENVDSIVNYEKVAFLGQAPVWVVGTVKSGDYIIPSGNDDGYGIAVSPEKIETEHMAQIVGRAWSDGSKAINLVNMAIGLKTNEISMIIQKQDKKMDEFENRLAALEDSLEMK